MAKDAVKVAADWAAKLGAAGSKIKDGVQAVTVSPTQKAAARADAFVNGVTQAVSSGKWQRGLQSVSLADWQNAMINKGVNRIGAGAQAALPKMTAFMQKLLPFQENALRNLDSQAPRGDFGANLQRMMAWAELMHQFKKNG